MIENYNFLNLYQKQQGSHSSQMSNSQIHKQFRLDKTSSIFPELFSESDKNFWPDVATFTRSVRGFIEYSIGDESEIVKHWTDNIEYNIFFLF